MASSSVLPVVTAALLLLLLSPTALSQACKSHKFTTPNKSFATCADLPYLSASLHYTFDPSKSTLSMAFTAPPAKSSGWVAWAINPTSEGMAGSQALLAFKSPNGSVSVSTLDVQSYSSLSPGPLSLKVSDLSGESSATTLTLFATWHLPSKTSSVNQVWQVGPSVSGGLPAKHDFSHPNLLSKSKLQLSAKTTAAAATTSISPAAAPSAGAPVSGSPAEKTTGGSASAPAPASGKNAAGEGLAGLKRFGACLALVMSAAFGFLF